MPYVVRVEEAGEAGRVGDARQRRRLRCVVRVVEDEQHERRQHGRHAQHHEHHGQSGWSLPVAHLLRQHVEYDVDAGVEGEEEQGVRAEVGEEGRHRQPDDGQRDVQDEMRDGDLTREFVHITATAAERREANVAGQVHLDGPDAGADDVYHHDDSPPAVVGPEQVPHGAEQRDDGHQQRRGVVEPRRYATARLKQLGPQRAVQIVDEEEVDMRVAVVGAGRGRVHW